MKVGFGVDVGGTTCKMGMFDGDGVLIEKWEIPTMKDHQGETVLSDIAKAIDAKIIEKNIERKDVLGIGIGVPGPVTPDGYVNSCVNIGWGKKNIVGELSEQTGFTVKAGNDANVAALGELVHGSGKGRKSLVMVTLGTGVGGGVVIDRKIIHGYTGAGGEIGHLKVNKEETRQCGCGKTGCLEQYVSATGIARMAKEALEVGLTNSIMPENPTAKDVFDAAAKQDSLALDIVERVGEILGMALANVTAIVNTEMIVIGGGVSKAGTILTDTIRKYYKQYAFHACEDIEIVLAKLGNEAGIYGCMGMLLD